MKLFGSIKELVSAAFRKNGYEVTLAPNAASYTQAQTVYLPTPGVDSALTLVAAGKIANADISATANIADSKLATISTAGKVSNSATTATNLNTAGAIVARDASGNFSAGTITAAFSGALNGTVGATTPNTGAFTTLSSTQGANLATSSGNVGIGTSSPSNKLDVIDDTSPNIRVGTSAQNKGAVYLGNSNHGLERGATGYGVNDIQLKTAGSGKIIITPTLGVDAAVFTDSGNVGIGTSTPGAKFNVVGNALIGGSNPGLAGAVQITTGGASPIQNRLTYGTDGSGWKFAIGKNQAGTVTEQVVIEDTGNVGIGTSNPSAKLNVASSESKTTSAVPLKIGTSTGGGNDFELIVSRNEAGVGGYYSIQSVEQNTGFRALSLNPSGGNVGISKSNPATALDVNGTVTATSFTGPSTAVNGLLPSQTGSANKYLKTDGSGTLSWASASGGSGEINAILNSSGADGITGWAAGTSHNTPVAFSGANNPLDGIVPTAFSFTASAGTASATSGQSGIGIYDDMSLPTALQNRKLKIEFAYSTPASSAGTWAVVLYQGTTRVALSTDSSGDTVLPSGVTGGKFTAYFDSTSASAYRLLLVQRTRTSANNLYLTNIIVGPGIQPQGAVVGEWTNFTPVPIEGTANTDRSSAFSALSGKYKRNADSIEFKVRLTRNANSIGAGVNGFGLRSPVGTINVTALPSTGGVYYPACYIKTSTTEGDGTTSILSSFPNLLLFEKQLSTTALAYNDTDLPANTLVEIIGTLPIAEWAGSGTVQLAQNDVEYAYNTTAWGTDNNTAFGYGPDGAQITGALSTELAQRVRFQSPIQAGDRLVLEFKDSDGVWLEVGGSYVGGNGIPTYSSLLASTATTTHGAAIYRVTNSNTEVNVVFGRYRDRGYNGTAMVTGDWSAGTRWRVRKSSAGAAVGFGIVQPGVSSGLVSASGLPGNTTGNAIAGGYVGQILPFTATNTTPATGTYGVAGSISLPAGVWLVFGTAGLSEAAGPAQVTLGFSTTTNSFSYSQHAVTTMTNNTAQQKYPVPTTQITVATTTTVNFVVYRWTTSYAAIGDGIFALRIA